MHVCRREAPISSVIDEPTEEKALEENEEYMLAMVTSDQEREDVSTTDSDGDVSP